MNPTLTIEWRHLEVDGRTCERCSDTGSEARRALETLQTLCGPHGIGVQWLETSLPAEQLAESNLLLINGQAIESLLPDTRAGSSDCPSCGTLLGAQADCRTLDRGAQALDSIPADLIVEAACRAMACCTSAA